MEILKGQRNRKREGKKYIQLSRLFETALQYKFGWSAL
jgi:hypothetical protein